MEINYDDYLAYPFAKGLNQPFVVKYENTSEKNAKGVLFGFNSQFFKKNHGSDDCVMVTNLQGSTYPNILAQSMTDPFTLGCLRVQLSKKPDNETIDYIVEDANGNMFSKKEFILMHFSVNQFQERVIDVNRNFKVHAKSRFEFDIPAKSSIIFTVFPINELTLSPVRKITPISKYVKFKLFCKSIKQWMVAKLSNMAHKIGKVILKIKNKSTYWFRKK